MRSFLLHHQDWVLVFIAALMLGGIVGFYTWGTNVLLTDLTHAIGSGASSSAAVQFNIDDAQKILSARGLLP